ncbi:hypothetical protein NE619_13215 [Anaerovorax odorimutans]|uniref:Uncharacterized protein n=1 Tax=Anaerovorax odorimutans TaxID=109327 RepID=A0ABT1RR65_9FIRM|nr:hypothetical protein [Anaerovorax odorimutans]MCQ4637687.1 hypothetical protein [Anaerovorax odorimutans]
MKQKMTFEERVAFHHEVEVEIKDKTTEKAIDIALDRPMQDLDDVLHALRHIDGVKIIEVCRDDSGQSSEIEFYDCEELPDEGEQDLYEIPPYSRDENEEDE